MGHITSRRIASRRMAIAAGLALVAAATAACGSGSSAATSGGTAQSPAAKLALTAYSTPQAAYEAIIPEFQKTTAGKNITFSQSYGASGAQSRAIAAGLPTDVAALSLAPDLDKLVDAGLVDANWTKAKNDGFVTNSVVVFAVREGNPKGIKTWDDLTKPGVQVLIPNPFQSGGAKWDVAAAVGAQLKQGKTQDQAIDYLKSLYKNVVAQDKDARTSMQTFTGGKGDVLLAYENEAITAKTKGEQIDYVIPAETILIQNPAAITKRASNAAAAQSFLDFLHTDAAQKIYADHGYRSVNPALVDPKVYPAPATLFTIEDLGGWKSVNSTYFDTEKGVLAEIEKSLGVTTG